MSEIRIWAANISVILIVTGIMMKTVTFESEKAILKFVATMLLVVTVFQLDTNALKSEFDFDIKDEISESTDEKTRQLSQMLSDMSENEAVSQIKDKFKAFDEDVKLIISSENGGFYIKFKSRIISDDDAEKIEKELEEYFECAFETERDEKLEG